MIYDCFTFYNELEILEIRLNELYTVVDKFVLVEATKTFTGKDKPLFYGDNKSKFIQFSDKIIHVVVNQYPTFFTKFRPVKAWDYENHQRESIKTALKNCKSSDIIIISDVDEIPKGEKVKKFSYFPGIKVFEQDLFYYFFNCLCIYYNKENDDVTAQGNKNDKAFWRGSVMLFYKNIDSIKKSRLLRDSTNKDILVVEEGGWHFSFLGGLEKVTNKLKAWSHANEASYNPSYLQNSKNIEELINNGKDLFGRGHQFKFIEIDDTFPSYLINNYKNFTNLIKPLNEVI